MKKINESFVCIHCGKMVPSADKTCRNHCPWCFCSLHVDGDIPGDRATQCHGKMFPVSYKLQGDRIRILFKCSKCGKQHRNKRLPEDEVTNLEELIKAYIPNFF